MLMTKDDRDEMRQLMKDVLYAHTAAIDGQFKVIASDLAHIKEQTTKTNGRVTKLEDYRQSALLTEANHFQNCPVAGQVELLKIESTSRKSLRNFLVYAGSFVVGSAAVIVAVIEILKAIPK